MESGHCAACAIMEQIRAADRKTNCNKYYETKRQYLTSNDRKTNKGRLYLFYNHTRVGES